MKLYTEEQLKQIFVTHYFITDKELEDLTPIELPSDQEIEEAKENAWSTYEYQEGNLYSTTFNGGFQLGAKWMRDKIQGGKK
jgi:hypothetical protein